MAGYIYKTRPYSIPKIALGWKSLSFNHPNISEIMQENFELTGEYITLCNLLKVCGVADTGGAAKLMIIDGDVEVDGQTELRKGCKIRSGQRVSGYGFAIHVMASSHI